MVRVTLFFVAGILSAIQIDDFPVSIVLPLAGLSALVFFAGVLRKSKIVSGLAGLCLVFMSGYLLVLQRTKPDCERPPGKVLMYKAVVSRFVEQRAKTYRSEATLLSIMTSEGWSQACGSVLMYFPKEGRQFEYGDILLVRGAPSEIPGPANPGEFNFKRFMGFRGVDVQDFPRSDSIRLIGNEPGSVFLSHAIKVRQWADAKITSVVKGEREQATATALVLGVTDGLDNELLTAYASTGALHVLAVSGLHVSIIYWIILLVLKPLDRTRPLKWLLAFISVFVLWSYAFVTGWSPSVLRAVTMFSFVAFSRPWRQSTNIYNTLASSMFCLLLYDPFFIMSTGFQLSYIAVFGIVFLQPRLYTLWEPHGRLADEIWKLSTVSIAAQLATLPIGLFYFHQFPNYFLPANLVVIPVSFVVLVTGLAVGVFAFIEPVIVVLGWLLTWSVRLMNTLVIAFGQLPYSVIDRIYLDQWQALLLAALIGTVSLLFVQKKLMWLNVALVAALAFAATRWNHLMTDVNAKVVRVYSAGNHTLIDRLHRGHSQMVGDSTVNEDWAKVFRLVAPAWIMSGVGQDSASMYSKVLVRRGCKVWLWDNVAFLQVTGRDHMLPRAGVNFLVISNNAVASLAELSTLKFEKIIVDGSNSLYFAERLRREAIDTGISLWSVPHDGAFEFRHVER
jgi:competence protein ComEC